MPIAAAHDGAATPPHGLPMAPPRSQDTVTAGLQQLFASVVDEPIPDDFFRLLDAIDEASTRLPGSSKGSNR